MTPDAVEICGQQRGPGRPRGSKDLTGRCTRVVAVVDGRRWIKHTVAAAILQARNDAGVAASELGASIGVSTSAVHGWESGRHEVPLRRLYQIAEALGIPVDHLVGAK